MGDYILYTSESVTEGHPDKLCDIISDTLLDAYFAEDKNSHVAMETMASKGMVFLSGEVTSSARFNIIDKVREAILNVGYDSEEKGLDGNNCIILPNVSVQSPDIAQGVDRAGGVIGAGDQGMMYGYACDETEEYMPLSITLAHKLCKRLTQVRKEGILSYLYPDGKAQVTVAYDDKDHVIGITAVVVSTQHSDSVSMDRLREDVRREVIDVVIPAHLIMPGCQIYINPTGRFVVGGPEGDTGLTGRKIIVDTYGGIARHGGGAFSGKDPTKVDRSAAYMARYAAKNIVAAGLCRKCEVNLAYAIGVPDPVSVRVDTFGTEELPISIIRKAVNETFDFSVAGIIRNLSLLNVSYRPVAAYGHFGRLDLDLPWERINAVKTLQERAVSHMTVEIVKQAKAKKGSNLKDLASLLDA
ncbi:MAG: methionine adenosyltransferase [Eubacterium sp.]|nr:methionine adenosyltransferase [Eubacterium sp.]